MSTKKKLIIAISAVSTVLVVMIATLVFVIVATTQTASSNVVVEYVSTDVSATASASYIIGEERTPLTYGTVETLEFVPGKNTAGYLSTNGLIELSQNNPRIIFEYVFTNTDTSVGINIKLSTSTTNNQNMTVRYAYQSDTPITDFTNITTNSSFSNQVLNANANGNAKKYIYIIIDAIDISSNARCTGSFSWTLVRA